MSERFTELAPRPLGRAPGPAVVRPRRRRRVTVRRPRRRQRRRRGDLLLVATGRRPNGDRLDLAGRRASPTHADGRVVVDEFQRTTVEGVCALGDVSSPYQLKHVANHEARVVAHNLLHPDDLRAHRPPVRAGGGVHRAADRRGRAAPRSRPAREGLDYAVHGAGLRRRRVRLGDGGHHRVLQGAGRPRHRAAAGRAHHRAAGVDRDPAADPGDVVRADARTRWPAASTGSTRRCPSWWRTPCCKLELAEVEDLTTYPLTP